MNKNALIVGAGSGNSAAIARALVAEGYRVALAARNIEKLEGQKQALDAITIACDATSVQSVKHLFQNLDQQMDGLDLVVYNASSYTSGPVTELDPVLVEETLRLTAYGGFLVAQQAARRMKVSGSGAIFFTGATASIKGFANFAPFAMGKFALRGLAQSLARELGPQNIHVAHFIIDGSIANDERQRFQTDNQSFLDADAIAHTYIAVLNQPRSAWTHEVDVRPWVESF